MATIIFSIVGLTGCAPRAFDIIPAATTVSQLDFTKYAESGFLFTPYQYSSEYEGMGIIKVVISAEATRKLEKNRRDQVLMGDWSITPITAQEALEKLYQEATSIGANAVVSLDLKYVPQTYPSMSISLPAWEVSGFAIKRN